MRCSPPWLCQSSFFLLMGSDPMEVSTHTIHPPPMILNQIHLSMPLYSLSDISSVRELMSFCILIRRKITQVVRKKNVWPTLYTKYLLRALQVLFSIKVKTGPRLVTLLSPLKEEANEAQAKVLKITSESYTVC